MSEKQSATLATSAVPTETRPVVAPHPIPAAPRASREKRHEPSETVRASVDRLIDQANRFSKQSEQERPEALRASFQFD